MGWLMKIFVLLALIGAQSLAFADCPPWLDSQIDKLHSSDVIELCDAVNNKPVLIVNTASHCGYTKQFKGLEAVHQKYKDQGLLVSLPTAAIKMPTTKRQQRMYVIATLV